MSALKVHIRLPFIFNGGEGAGGIRRVAPVVYDGPPLHKKLFSFPSPPPLMTQINGDDLPHQKKKEREKMRKEKREREQKMKKSVSLSLSPNETLGSPEACFLGKI